MAEETQFRPDSDGSKRKLDEIQMAKQKAQEIVARLVNNAEAKRPRFDDASESDSLRSPMPPPDFSQKPFNQSNTNATFGSAPFVPQPTPYPNFQGTSKKMDIPNGKVGVVIGKGGETIKYIQLQSGARIQITRDADADPYSQTRDVELIGTAEQVSRAEQLIKDVIAESDTGGSGTSAALGSTSMQQGSEQFAMKVPNNKVAKIIGKGGETIKSMQSSSGARIQVIPLHLPPGDTSTERNVYISGTKEQIELAKELVNEVISENRPRNPSVNYMQQGYPPSGNWADTNSVQQAGYGYTQQGPTPPYYSGYPPQPAGWDQQLPSASAQPPPPQSAGYNYYVQQGQTGPAPANANYGYAQALPATGYSYDQGYSQQQQPHGYDGTTQGEQDPHNQYASLGYGPSGATPVTPDGTTNAQTYGTQTSTAVLPAQPFGTQSTMPVPPAQSVGLSTEPYATQSSTLVPPGQPAAFGTRPGITPAGYMPYQNYSGPPPPSNAQMGFSQMGYGGQQPPQTGYPQSGYPPQPALAQATYVQGSNPATYGLPQPQATTHVQPQPPAYGSEGNRDGTVGSYGSTAATQESVRPQS
eukprot:TRINITY_DN19830_c1_g1_i1.p1 TRINITY_DN19830_c1_g1~~TRINITY_DN19830_c1_g1_i1.p1  ORF type:complete len:585 (+),score=138.01 TRINITY_DN19830_c1_g1_i1:154-1908(+)